LLIHNIIVAPYMVKCQLFLSRKVIKFLWKNNRKNETKNLFFEFLLSFFAVFYTVKMQIPVIINKLFYTYFVDI